MLDLAFLPQLADLFADPRGWVVADAAAFGFAVAVVFWMTAAMLRGLGIERVASVDVDPDRAWDYGLRLGGLGAIAFVAWREIGVY